MHEFLQALRDRLGVLRRLRVDLTEQRLSEVGQRRAGKAADEALCPDDSELEVADRARAPGALEHVHARLLDHGAQFVRLACVEVVIAEHGEDRDVETAARVGDDLGLLGLARGREVTREQDHVASSATVSNARSTRSRVASEACRSPAAAMRITRSCCTQRAKRKRPISCPSFLRRADRGDESRRRRFCSRQRSRSCSAAVSRPGRAAVRRASTTSTSCSSPRMRMRRSPHSTPRAGRPSARPKAGSTRPGTRTARSSI